ncbi:MAG TPA: FAD-dependent oxidoreductase [Gemmataceae bacterium]|jgi:NADPH-dependent glutamate synthase beta subunit-like oxidoreductase/NAD(P)H-flavin reductase
MNNLHLPSSSRSTATAWNFPLGIEGFRYADLNRVRRLMALHQVFRADLRAVDPALADRYEHGCAEGQEDTQLLIDVANHLDRFLARLFHIEKEVLDLNRHTTEDRMVYEFKKRFLDRLVLKTPPASRELAAANIADVEFRYRERVAELLTRGEWANDPERELAEVGLQTLDRLANAKTRGDASESAHCEERLRDVSAWACVLAFHPELKHRRRQFASFVHPEKLDFDNLVAREFNDPALPTLFEAPAEGRRHRDGFGLTDPRMAPREALREMHYCIICHPRDKDSCSKGLREKDGSAKKNPLGIELEGCPLKEKISEAHLLKREGHGIGALAAIMVDNPLCAGTGHRICNDCMKSCIYQKQTPVNIPQIETSILSDVLHLPYGFEIYSLLSRWNPLNLRRPFPLPYNGKNILVVGMGPAGYTLAHHLLNDGFGVVGIDGLRIEPLSVRMRGAKRRVPQPIRDINDITGPLDRRIILGFGGVSEYGITVRWDKNFLDINYLLLMRRKKFRLYDGIRFGGTLTLDDAWNLGFDHVAICTGAGKPTLAAMKNNLLRGVRLASDFLMGLQATGAYKANSLANLQLRLPAVVIGGGLTAIDTATEMQAYYVVQAEKTLDRYDRLMAKIGEQAIWANLNAEEREIIDTWLKHGRAIRAERSAAAAAGRQPDFNRLVRAWGGVTIVYRKRLQDSPAYRLNHEEVIKSLEEGIRFAERLNPVECIADVHGAVAEIRCEYQVQKDGRWQASGEFVTLPARAVMIAAGTHPNVTYNREHPGTFQLDDKGEFYRGHKLQQSGGAKRLVPAGRSEIGFFTSYEKHGRYVTFFGDNHPHYAGNVVKAMASAKDGHTEIHRVFQEEIAREKTEDQAERERNFVLFSESLDEQLVAEVVDALRLTHQIVEVVVRAPLAARNFHPGEFYRLQNYETFAEEVEGIKLTMEGIALTGAWVDRERGLISLIVLEMGGSSRLCSLLEPGEKVVLMGPTGAPTEIPRDQTVVLAGGGLGNAVLFSIALALKEKNNKVIYFAGYRAPTDLFKRHEIEKACDVVVWSTDRGPCIQPARPQDRTFLGNIVESMQAYASGQLGEQLVPLDAAQRIIAIGSDRMMSAVKNALADKLRAHFPRQPTAIGSINSPMQCMMKEICAQCLQRHVDPETKAESFVFSCFNQDQLLQTVDFAHLDTRLRQNSAAEKLTSLWIDHLFSARLVQTV